MRTWVAVLTLLFASLVLVAGCGGGESGISDENTSEEAYAEMPSETSTETPSEAPAEDASEPTTSAMGSEVSQVSILDIINSFGERLEVEVEVADNIAEQRRGLMERTELAENAGMLFVFDGEQVRSFTMKNTLIPLSIAFIDAGGVIVDIQDMEPLDDVPPDYISAGPAQYALEVNQGFFANRGIEVGNVVELPGLPGSLGTPSSAEMVQAFRNAGLEVGESYPVEHEPNWEEKPIPKNHTEATRFLIPSLEGDAGGRVFVFGSEADLRAVRSYYESLPGSVKPHLYVEGQVLLQITNQLSREEADRYGAVLREMV
jgi:uncharacterized membrane protein (UPF0127 family)